MTVSILDEVIAKKLTTGPQLKEHFQSKNLSIFTPIFESSANDAEAASIILFILYAYTEESPYLIARANSEKEMQSICERLQIPEYIQTWLISLPDEKPQIRKAVIDYLEYFAPEMWSSLQFNKIQLKDMQRIITTKSSTDKHGQFSPQKHMECIKQANYLSTVIDDIYSEVKSKYKYIAIGKDNAIRAKKSGKGISVENSELIQ